MAPKIQSNLKPEIKDVIRSIFLLTFSSSDKGAFSVLDALHYNSQNNHSLHLNGVQTGSKKNS